MAAILIVEDRPIDRKLLATLLTSAGHTVSEASDGEEGLRVAEAITPDLVISDILMPADGDEFVRRLRGVKSLARTGVILYTATCHEREAHALAEQCDVADILIKPSAPKVILARVEAVPTAGPGRPFPDAAQVSRDHLRVVNSALEAKSEEFEASERRMTTFVSLGHEFAAERNPRILMDMVCAAAREVTQARQAFIATLTNGGAAIGRVVTAGSTGRRPAGWPRRIRKAHFCDR